VKIVGVMRLFDAADADADDAAVSRSRLLILLMLLRLVYGIQCVPFRSRCGDGAEPFSLAAVTDMMFCLCWLIISILLNGNGPDRSIRDEAPEWKTEA
jgi:hypothetical protein